MVVVSEDGISVLVGCIKTYLRTSPFLVHSDYVAISDLAISLLGLTVSSSAPAAALSHESRVTVRWGFKSSKITSPAHQSPIKITKRASALTGTAHVMLITENLIFRNVTIPYGPNTAVSLKFYRVWNLTDRATVG